MLIANTILKVQLNATTHDVLDSREVWFERSFLFQYCEYMPEPAKCRQWLEKNFPNEFARLTMGKHPLSFTILICFYQT